MEGLRLALATFDNVFDTTPNRRVVTLDALLDGLSRFEVRSDTAAKIRKREGHIHQAWDKLSGGGLPSGKEGSRMIEAFREAERAGEDGLTAAASVRDALLYEAHHDAKRLIALWSPACYGDDARRTSEDVLHLSCLGLDYDAGIALDEIRAHWLGHFAAVHTTWSHTAERPRFRAILPLARPVRAEDWSSVWDWAFERTARTVDPAPKGRAATFALPAIPARDAPHGAWRLPGELLDPVAMGLAAEAPPPRSVPWTKPHHFDGGRRDKEQVRVELAPVEAPVSSSDAAPSPSDELDFDAFD